MGKKFPNVKRYGLEGAESMMVALDRLFEISAKGTLVVIWYAIFFFHVL
jgi:probable 2-oxoglutarate dehydrogenase E1 component DHKTD1